MVPTATSPEPPEALVVALDRVRSVYNVGAFFRTGDATGVDKLYLCGYTAAPPHRGIAKTALGAEQHLGWEHRDDVTDLLHDLRGRGYQIAAVETAEPSVDIHAWTPRYPLCLVFGNEVDGIQPAALELADVRVRLPMLGVKDSLNVAVAGGAVLYELLRQRRETAPRPRSM